MDREGALDLPVRRPGPRPGRDHGEWLGEKRLDTPGGYDAQYEPIAIDGDLVVAHGPTRFFDPLTGATQAEYDNIWVLRFGPDGRCAEFHEWYARRPDDARRAGQLSRPPSAE